MKKVLSFIAIAAVATSVVACGPSKAEQEAKEKAKQDSIKQADSLKAVEEAAKMEEQRKMDSANAAAAAEKAKADSIRVADSLAAASKKGGKKH